MTSLVLDRVLTKCARVGDCLVFQGGRGNVGYGAIKVDGRTHYAHRIVAEAHHGPAPSPKHEVLHSCDNRRCVEHTHLRWGTRSENIADMIARNRQRNNPIRGEQHPDAKLTQNDVLVIRARRRNGELLRVIASDYGVDQSNISAIAHYKTWKHLEKQ